jgi:hypothetical protein
MNFMILFLTSASLFSIDGLGQDMSAFQTPFMYIGKYTRIEFTVRPEWTLLRQGSDIRSVFWSNPFQFYITAPVYRGFAIAAGNRERFNQNFDVRRANDDLRLHVISRGGVEEVFGSVGYGLPLGEFVVQGSYLFGNTYETWDYTIGDYNLVDTFLYKYTGEVFSAGFTTKYVSCYFETFGTLDMTRPSMDTTFDLPQRFGIGVHALVLGGHVSAGYEYSWWQEEYGFQNPHRFSIAYDRDTYGFGYRFSPWYLERVSEHGVDLSYKVPLPYLGMMRLHLDCAVRQTDNVQEFMIAPQIELSIRELFVKRRK